VRRAQLIERFPGLAEGHFRFTSPDDHSYNCCAFAVYETWRCWDPQPFANLYWPEGAPRVPTLAAYVAAYGTRGFLPATTADLEFGLEKIAIYVGTDGVVSHVARQLDSGIWTSKLGPREDIEHELAGLEGSRWGSVQAVLARARPRQTELAF